MGSFALFTSSFCHGLIWIKRRRRRALEHACAHGIKETPLYSNTCHKIILTCLQFQVKVDGKDIVEYEQKLSMKTINCLRIENDVILYKVKLE